MPEVWCRVPLQMVRFADVTRETGQSNPCIDTVFQQQNGAPDAFSRAGSTSGELPATLLSCFLRVCRQHELQLIPTEPGFVYKFA